MDQKQKSVYKSSGWSNDSDLSVAKEVKPVSVDEVIARAMKAVSAAKVTIAAQKGGMCGCFGE